MVPPQKSIQSETFMNPSPQANPPAAPCPQAQVSVQAQAVLPRRQVSSIVQHVNSVILSPV